MSLPVFCPRNLNFLCSPSPPLFHCAIRIAHRLHTIIDADEVIVLSEGKVLEKGEPHSLLAEGGAFFAMVQETGEATAQNLSAAAREAHAQRRDSILNEHDAPL